MKREVYAKLLDWKSRKDHKPLVLDGARQVGKTYILKEFGNKEYKTLSYVNLDKDAVAKSIFEPDHDIPRIIRTLSAHTGVDIVPKDTLHVTLQDQDLLQNAKDALSDYEQKLVDKFHNVETNPDNVKQIIDIIHKLHAGIRKITINHEDILAVIDGLMTPKDVIKAFKELIETRTAGAEGDNIRILIK